MPDEKNLHGAADTTFIFENTVDTTLTDLYTFLCKQFRSSRRLPIRFLADPVQHTCDNNGTRVASLSRSWNTIPVNVEFTEPALYYCEYEIISLYSVKFIMFGFMSKENVENTKCIMSNRFYLYHDELDKKVKVESKISLYVDYRSGGKMHLFIDDVYAASEQWACFPAVPVMSITRKENIVQLNPDTFVSIPWFHPRHVLPIKNQ
jgi:hypothetical protein